MRKFYFSVLVVFFATVAKAQCDTINMPVPGNWSDTFYYAPSPFPGFPGGYINGVNSSSGGDLQKANYFDLSSTSYGYIYGAIIKFGKANPTKLIDTSKMVYFKVYADNSGSPGTLLISDSTNLGQIRKDVSLGQNTVINFPATALPSSKKFYVSVDISNLTWSLGGTTRDSLWIGSTRDDQTANTAWEFESDSTWHPFSDTWTSDSAGLNPMDVTLWIFPYVGVSASGCA